MKAKFLHDDNEDSSSNSPDTQANLRLYWEHCQKVHFFTLRLKYTLERMHPKKRFKSVCVSALFDKNLAGRSVNYQDPTVPIIGQ